MEDRSESYQEGWKCGQEKGAEAAGECKDGATLTAEVVAQRAGHAYEEATFQGPGPKVWPRRYGTRDFFEGFLDGFCAAALDLVSDDMKKDAALELSQKKYPGQPE